MSKVIFGAADGDSGLVICHDRVEGEYGVEEQSLIFNAFGDGSHAYATLDMDEVQALHICLSRLLNASVEVGRVNENE